MCGLDSVSDKRSLVMRMLMTPEFSNFSGVVHGGHLMRLLDQVAYACATRYCGIDVVTVHADGISFKNPIPIGSLVTFLSRVNYTGKSSIEVGIKVISEDLKNKTSIHTNSSYFTMVALDSYGRALEIERFTPLNSEDKRRYEDAKKRKEFRAK